MVECHRRELICSIDTPALRPGSAAVRRRSRDCRSGFTIILTRFWTIVSKPIVLMLSPVTLFRPRLRITLTFGPTGNLQSTRASARRSLMGTARSLAPFPEKSSTVCLSYLIVSSKLRLAASSRRKLRMASNPTRTIQPADLVHHVQPLGPGR